MVSIKGLMKVFTFDFEFLIRIMKSLFMNGFSKKSHFKFLKEFFGELKLCEFDFFNLN